MRLGIFGGSFNPVHIGHLRLVVEAAEIFKLDQVDIIPAYTPPHKNTDGLLPYELRLDLLRSIFQDTSWVNVRDLESQRQGPSYSYDTLVRYAEENRDDERFFLLGATDLITLTSWYRGKEIPDLVHLATLNRMDAELASVGEFISTFWPGAWLAKEQPLNATIWRIPQSGNVYYATIPRLDISSSQVRRLWLAQKEILGLVPDAVVKSLMENQETVKKIWEAGL